MGLCSENQIHDHEHKESISSPFNQNYYMFISFKVKYILRIIRYNINGLPFLFAKMDKYGCHLINLLGRAIGRYPSQWVTSLLNLLNVVNEIAS